MSSHSLSILQKFFFSFKECDYRLLLFVKLPISFSIMFQARSIAINGLISRLTNRCDS